MSIMWAVIALISLGIIVAIIAIVQKKFFPSSITEESCTELPPEVGGCCGMHMTCERDSLLSAVSAKIVYYDDEKLDRFKGRGSEDYTAEEVEEFRDILITLEQDDVAGWVRSLQLREIVLPEELKPEMFLIVEEARAYHMEHGPGDKH